MNEFIRGLSKSITIIMLICMVLIIFVLFWGIIVVKDPALKEVPNINLYKMLMAYATIALVTSIVSWLHKDEK